MKGIIVIGMLLLCAAFPFVLFAQSNEHIDDLLEQYKVEYSLAVYMVLTAGDYIPDDTEPREAVEALRGQPWKITLRSVGKPIRLGDYAFLIMKALDIKGGIMYSLFPGPRYATRELYFKGIIDEDFSVCRTLTGAEALRILRKSLEYEESQA